MNVDCQLTLVMFQALVMRGENQAARHAGRPGVEFIMIRGQALATC